MVILNFHGIGPITREIDAEEKDCWIEKSFLCSILDIISDSNNIQLTVDDGNKSDLIYLLPELKRRDLTCTFFICSERIGKPNFLNSNDIKEIQSAGMQIGTHGSIHKSWKNLNKNELHKEIIESAKTLEDITGQKIKSAAFPFGEYDRRSLSFLRKAGFEKVYTSCTGHCSSSGWLQVRNTIRRTMDINEVKKILISPSLPSQIKNFLKVNIKSLR